MPKQITCQKCNKTFDAFQKVNGKYRYYHNRKYCLTCSPFGKHNRRNLNEESDKGKVKVCTKCGKKYVYDRRKGHRKYFCNSCKTICRDIKRKEKCIEYKGGCCIVCGYNKCVRALKFHHLDPSKKKFAIGQSGGRSWESVKKELDKCVLLCGNCHDEVHSNLITESFLVEKENESCCCRHR